MHYFVEDFQLRVAQVEICTLVNFGEAGDVAVPSDYDGDGKMDIAVFRPSTGIWYIERSTARGLVMNFGEAGGIAVPNDYDGDGKMDIAVFRPRTGMWYIQRSTAGGLVMNFGEAGDVPVSSVNQIP